MPEVVEAFHGTRQSVPFAGRHLRLVEATQWRRMRNDPRYELIDLQAAREILAEIAKRPAGSRNERDAAARAMHRLADTRTGSDTTGVLLLAIRSLVVARPAREDAPVTPSQLARLLGREDTDEEHWIEIELVWIDGTFAAGERFCIITPDGQEIRGVTDSRGRARVAGIARDGACQVSFPDLYDEDWRNG